MPYRFNPISGMLDYYASAPTDYVTTAPATQVRNTIQPTADVTGLTVKKYYAPATAIDPATLGAVRVAHYIADDFTSGATPWPDASGNGYTLTAGGGGASKVLNVVNGHAVVRFTQNNHSYRNTAGFTLAQPFVMIMVAKSQYSGTASAGSVWFAQGSGTAHVQFATYYEYANGSPGWTPYGGTAWTPTDTYGTVGRFQVVVVKYNGASTYVRSGGNANTTGDTGTNSLVGVTLGNNVLGNSGAGGDLAECIVLNDPSDATIAGVEAHLAQKYNLEQESSTQQDDFLEFQSGVGESLLRVNKEGTIIPTLFGASKSALDVGVFSDAYPRWKFTPARVEIGDGTYDVEGQTGYYQKGWNFDAPGTSNGNYGFTAKSNYIDQNFQVRPPGNSLFAINTGLARVVISTYIGSHICSETADRVGLDVRGFAGQTANIMRWTNSSGTTLSCIKRNGAAQFLSTEIIGEATSVLTGTINPTASTAVVGVGTLFTTQLVVGDRITVSGETRTVTAITDALNLTVDTAFTDTANDTTPDKLGAILVLKTSAGAVKAVMNDLGNIGVGTVLPTAYMHLGAGTATANTAPLKFTSGTSLTTAEAGAVEFTTDDYYATITTGAARKGIILNDGTNLTSGKIPVATTNGRLVDSTGVSGSFTTVDGKTVTVTNGLITSIV